MAVKSAEELFDLVNIEYEHQYSDNPVLLDNVRHAISLLAPKSRVLDVGCGTGVPVASTLLQAGMHVTGIDISQRMIDIAHRQAPGGTYVKADMATYEPLGEAYDAVFVIFSPMQLSLREFRNSMLKFATCLRPGGIWLMVTVPADNYVPDPAAYDETGSYAEDIHAPFMGYSIKVLLFSAKGLLDFHASLGLEILRHKNQSFLPKTTDPYPEDQIFIIARRTDDHPLMGPYPIPKVRPPRLTLNQDFWPRFEETVKRRDIDAVLHILESNKKVLDIGSGDGGTSLFPPRTTYPTRLPFLFPSFPPPLPPPSDHNLPSPSPGPRPPHRSLPCPRTKPHPRFHSFRPPPKPLHPRHPWHK